jgi:threonine synthase
MTTLKERNIFALEVDAPFDDLQTMAKALFNDHDFKAKYKLGSMNSINWARILAQAVYYGYASLQMTGRGKSKLVDFSVPTGNVGNVLSAFVAKKMGFPIDQIIVATNENDVMHQSLLTGVYRLRTSADIVQTTSPSMDIAIASNYERLFFEASGRRPKLIRTLWAELAKEGSFYAPATARKLRADGWRSGRTNMMEVEGTIRDIYEKYEKVIDPHTAVGVHVGLQFRKSEVPLVVVETAQAAKFEDTIRRAIGIDPPKPKGYKELMSASEYHIPLHADVKALKQFIIDHV